MTFRLNGAAARAIRVARQMPQVAVAGQLGISAPYLANIERGRRNASPEIVAKYAEILGVTVDTIALPMPEVAA